MDKFVVYFVGFFFVIGGVDYLIGNKFKVGEKFEEGIKTMGPMAITMVGILSLTPIISSLISSYLGPILGSGNIDPSILPAMILAPDMGAYKISMDVALNNDVGIYSAVLIASTLGTTLSFSLPMALTLIDKKDTEVFAKGVICGIITIPIGALIVAFYKGMNMKLIFINTIPIIVFSLILTVLILKSMDKAIVIFNIIGKCIISISVIAMLIQGLQFILDITIVSNFLPMEEVLKIVCKISFFLGGAYPMISVISRIFKKPFTSIGHLMGVNSVAVTGFLGALASSLLIFVSLKDMNEKGKIIASALSVSLSFIFGGQMGFIASLNPEFLGAFMLCKLICGILACILANILFKIHSKKNILITENI
ncbi:ethanolamine utilization protein EutH [Clostridium hydrogeniformans]|uniref:ethanolamine utilization protein EutH n=1 Tax=Clostridium hydrogeniformans TaxID=349933 RepID=UPI000489CF04|nr:ethanolamine utilization protein EutH [Clostridium hydrogeniformans]